MSERDPRINPLPGDVLIYGPQWQLERCEVIGLIKHGVRYRLWGGEVACLIGQWREWMRGAEVIRRHEDCPADVREAERA